MNPAYEAVVLEPCLRQIWTRVKCQRSLFSVGGQGQSSAQLMNDDPEPWGFRGGLSGEFQVT